MIELKSAKELAIIQENAVLLAQILERLTAEAEPGVSTGSLARLAEELMARVGGEPAFKGYRGYPAAICASLNEEVVHGLPKDDKILKKGDLLSIDLGLKRRGFYADLATTVIVGGEEEGTPQARRLIAVAREALRRGIAAARVGNRVSDISWAIGSYVESQGYSVVKRFVGHGIGRELHEEPQVPNFGPPGQGPRLRPGMVLCIEPMVKEDQGEERVLEDGWTVVTPEGGLAAHFEEMVLISEEGPKVLARPDNK